MIILINLKRAYRILRQKNVCYKNKFRKIYAIL